MAETSLAGLEPRLQKQVESARVAYGRGNFDYTVSLCRTILKETPGCVSVRKLHRDAALRLHHGSGSPFALELGPAFRVPVILRAPKPADSEPLQALSRSEAMIEDNPHNVDALRLLGRAATELGWKETAIFAFQALRDETPRDADNLVALGEAQLATGRIDDALATAGAALKLEAGHVRAQVLAHHASMAQTIRSGRGGNAGSSRVRY